MSSILKKLGLIKDDGNRYELEIDYVKVRRLSGVVTGAIVGWQTYRNELYFKVQADGINVSFWVRQSDVLDMWQESALVTLAEAV